MESIQRTFLPVDYFWQWTENWYEWDSKAAHSAAKKARNAEAKRLEGLGYTVKKWSNPKALISRGGIGSGHPHIEVYCSAYGLEAWREAKKD